MTNEKLLILVCRGGGGSARDTRTSLKYLLTNGVDVNAQNERGQTALMWAAYGTRVPIVRLLLAASADVSAHDDNGMTALAWVLRRSWHGQRSMADQAEIAGLLIGASPVKENAVVDSAYVRAVRENERRLAWALKVHASDEARQEGDAIKEARVEHRA
jgi:ankyrin repeat protein